MKHTLKGFLMVEGCCNPKIAEKFHPPKMKCCFNFLGEISLRVEEIQQNETGFIKDIEQ